MKLYCVMFHTSNNLIFSTGCNQVILDSVWDTEEKAEQRAEQRIRYMDGSEDFKLGWIETTILNYPQSTTRNNF